jgi:hypothetical protein
MTGLLLAAGGGVAAAMFYILRRSPSGLRPAPRIPAYRKALDAIERIAAAGWLERGDFDQFYTQLSAVVRHYVEDRFGIHAPEQTTEEFLSELAHRPTLAGPHRSLLARFLEQSDLVKFARAHPSSREGESALQSARTFVQETRDESILVEVA